MKRSVLVFSMAVLLLTAGLISVTAQEPQTKPDTVNMDTEAKPEFYYPVEDETAGTEKGSSSLIAIIAAVVVVGGFGAFFFLKKKK
jgi:LPXTG-motif cell wall-anchored protein